MAKQPKLGEINITRLGDTYYLVIKHKTTGSKHNHAVCYNITQGHMGNDLLSLGVATQHTIVSTNVLEILQRVVKEE